MSITRIHVNDNTLVKVVKDRRLTRVYHPPYESFIEDLRYMFNEDVYKTVKHTITYIRLVDNKRVTRQYEYKVDRSPKFREFTPFEKNYIATHSIEECIHWFKKSETWIRGVKRGSINKIHV